MQVQLIRSEPNPTLCIGESMCHQNHSQQINEELQNSYHSHINSHQPIQLINVIEHFGPETSPVILVILMPHYRNMLIQRILNLRLILLGCSLLPCRLLKSTALAVAFRIAHFALFWLLALFFRKHFIPTLGILTFQLQFPVEVLIHVLQVELRVFPDGFGVFDRLDRNYVISFALLLVNVPVRNLFGKRRQGVRSVPGQLRIGCQSINPKGTSRFGLSLGLQGILLLLCILSVLASRPVSRSFAVIIELLIGRAQRQVMGLQFGRLLPSRLFRVVHQYAHRGADTAGIAMIKMGILCGVAKPRAHALVVPGELHGFDGNKIKNTALGFGKQITRQYF